MLNNSYEFFSEPWLLNEIKPRMLNKLMTVVVYYAFDAA